MRCPYCREGNCRVLDTSNVEDAVRRRRGCLKCGQRFTTYERLAPVGLFVVKRNGRREPFNREKLYRSVCAACAKRPISQERIEEVVAKVETDLLALGKAEVDSMVIGEMTMEQLRGLDDVAYGFASFYRLFKQVAS
jgi:transcriptional repressor NrdR